LRPLTTVSASVSWKEAPRRARIFCQFSDNFFQLSHMSVCTFNSHFLVWPFLYTYI